MSLPPPISLSHNENSIMIVSPDTPTTNPKREPIKYCPICQSRVSDQLELYVHVAHKHDDWSKAALAALLDD